MQGPSSTKNNQDISVHEQEQSHEYDWIDVMLDTALLCFFFAGGVLITHFIKEAQRKK